MGVRKLHEEGDWEWFVTHRSNERGIRCGYVRVKGSL